MPATARNITGALVMLLIAASPAVATVADDEAEASLHLEVSTDQLVYGPGDPITLRVSAHNPRPEPVTLSFPTSHQAGYVMNDTYDWAEGRAFLQVLTDVEVPARSSHAWRFEHDWDAYDLEPGTHQVEGYLVGYGRSEPARFRVAEAISLEATPPRGDLNGDGRVDAADVAGFVQALTDPQAYEQAHDVPVGDVADINQDGRVDAGDVAPFVNLLTGGEAGPTTDAQEMVASQPATTAIPEPGTLTLLGLAGLLACRRR